jgi:diphosphomevalonate decarboxylase
MGKRNGQNAVNSSLSWSLDHLRSFVQIEKIAGGEDQWQPLESYGPMELSEKGRAKFLKHFQFLKDEFKVRDQAFLLRSGNNFPSDCGIASSASSFAALTLAAASALSELKGTPQPSLEQIADWSRQGSGSSCRSIFSGWVAWDQGRVYRVPSSIKTVFHQVFLVSGEKKAVSSSEAHQRVQTSRLMIGREERAQERFHFLKSELSILSFSWQQIFQLSWADFWDMHALFETSHPTFGYMTGESLNLVNAARDVWTQTGDGPVVTMDAGPNVHLLWREDQKQLAREFEKNHAGVSCLHNLGAD